MFAIRARRTYASILRTRVRSANGRRASTQMSALGASIATVGASKRDAFLVSTAFASIARGNQITHSQPPTC
jgi:hypothetical protein